MQLVPLNGALPVPQPTLTNLGIKMDSNTANDLMTEKIGVAPKLIYAIKSVVDGLNNNLAATRTTKLGATLSADTRPTATLVESQRLRTEKLTKKAGDLRCARHFALSPSRPCTCTRTSTGTCAPSAALMCIA